MCFKRVRGVWVVSYCEYLLLFNVLVLGSLVMDHPGSTPAIIQGKPLLFGTVHGAIGSRFLHV